MSYQAWLTVVPLAVLFISLALNLCHVFYDHVLSDQWARRLRRASAVGLAVGSLWSATRMYLLSSQLIRAQNSAVTAQETADRAVKNAEDLRKAAATSALEIKHAQALANEAQVKASQAIEAANNARTANALSAIKLQQAQALANEARAKATRAMNTANRLRSAAAPRTMSKDDDYFIAKAIRQYGGMHVNISTRIDDPEASQFGRYIGGALNFAGWKVDELNTNTMEGGSEGNKPLVIFHSAQTSDAANALITALQQRGFSASGFVNGSLAQDTLGIWVGQK